MSEAGATPAISPDQQLAFLAHLADRLGTTEIAIAAGKQQATLLNVACAIETLLAADAAGNPVFALCARPLADHALGDLFPTLPAGVTGVVLRKVQLTNAAWLYLDGSATITAADVRLVAALLQDTAGRSLGELGTEAIGGVLFLAANASGGDALKPVFDTLGLAPASLAVRGGVRFPLGFPNLWIEVPVDGVPAPLAGVGLRISAPIWAPPMPAELTLFGALDIGGGERVSIEAEFPLDGRTLIATAALTSASAFLSRSLAAGLGGDFAVTIPPSGVSLLLTLSRTGASVRLERVSLRLDLPGITLTGALALSRVQAQVTVFDPLADARIVIALLEVEATLGKTRPVTLLGTATYPDRFYTLGLAPGSPPSLADLFDAFGLDFVDGGDKPSRVDALSLSYAGRIGALSAQVAVSGSWTVGPVTLNRLSFDVATDQSGPSAGATAEFVIGGVVFDLSGYYARGDWTFSGLAAGEVSADDLIGAMADKFDISRPAPFLGGLTLTGAGVEIDTAETAFTFQLSAALPLDASTAALSISIALTGTSQPGARFMQSVTGTLDLEGHRFRVDGRTGDAGSLLIARWSQTEGGQVGLNDLMAALGLDPGVPRELDLALTELSFAYDSTAGKVFVLEAKSAHYGEVALLAHKPLEAASWEGAISLNLGRTLDLARLPLIGGALPDNASAKLTINRASAKTRNFGPVALEVVGKAWASVGQSGRPEIGPETGFCLAMTFDAGGQSRQFRLGGEREPAPEAALSGTPSGQQTAPDSAQPAPAAKPEPVPASDGRRWLDIQKSFGPVSLRRVGLGWESPKIVAVIDASLTAGGLTLSVLGLGAKIPVKSFVPEFTFDGIDICYAQGLVRIAGGLTGSFEGKADLTGQLTLQTAAFSLAAIAAYTMADDAPSMFAFALLNDRPLGGPPAFFVTGLAAGIGLNRVLRLPELDGVADFPLVRWARGGAPPGGGASDPSGVLESLAQSGVVAPFVGQSWLAAGVRFTSFRLVDSFVLLAVPLSGPFRLDLIGISTLDLPPRPSSPFVHIELAIKASFDPAQGLLAIDGALSPNSYVLSKKCHLMGGFAFYNWFAGEHEGEFVVTAGGYSPRFSAPAHYPKVPRLGFRWQIDSNLSVVGSEYFALTSAAIMAGGRLEAVWRSGGIRAWFTVEADFLLYFQPLCYHARFSCELGCSFEIDLWLTTVRITAHLGVGVEIWGPDFSGEVEVDLSLISFRIGFGETPRIRRKPIEWDKFISTLLPESKLDPSAAAAAIAPASPIVQLRMTGGLLQTLSEAPGLVNDVADSQGFELLVSAAIPAKNADAPGQDSLVVLAEAELQPLDAKRNPIMPAMDLAVAPCSIASAQFEPKLQVSVITTTTGRFKAVRVLRNVPAALWRLQTEDEFGAPRVDPLNGATVPNALVGWRLLPNPVQPSGWTPPVPSKLLEVTTYGDPRRFAWSHPTVPQLESGGPVPLAPAFADNRSALLAAAARAGCAGLPSKITIGDPADATTTTLADPPTWSRLGQPQPRAAHG